MSSSVWRLSGGGSFFCAGGNFRLLARSGGRELAGILLRPGSETLLARSGWGKRGGRSSRPLSGGAGISGKGEGLGRGRRDRPPAWTQNARDSGAGESVLEGEDRACGAVPPGRRDRPSRSRKGRYSESSGGNGGKNETGIGPGPRARFNSSERKTAGQCTLTFRMGSVLQGGESRSSEPYDSFSSESGRPILTSWPKIFNCIEGQTFA